MLKPQVAIIMGSDSDLPVMEQAASVLKEFSVPFEISVLSAHRTPDETSKYAKEALGRGIKVIIAGAGGAAALAGVVAAHFPLPVIGVPIKTSTLSGIDSLYSIVQMPTGVPVATVGINASQNAALLAIKILATYDKQLKIKLDQYKESQKDKVLKKSAELC